MSRELREGVSDTLKGICVPLECENAVEGDDVEYNCGSKAPSSVLLDLHPTLGSGCKNAVVDGKRGIIRRVYFEPAEGN